MKKKAYFIFSLFAALMLVSSCKTQKPETEGNWDGCVVGMFTADSTASFPWNGEGGILAFEDLIHHKVGSVLIYPTWADSFPAKECMMISNAGAIPHITWELFWPAVTYNTAPVDSNGYAAMNEVLAGKHDDYIKKFAQDAKAYGGKVMIRFLHEFNGNWYMWSGLKNGAANGGPAKVVAVWKYVVDKFRAEGATNVKWVWCPHGPSPDLSMESWNDIRNYWPGSDYVDWFGLDAYNWYPKDPWGGNRPYDSFESCFRALYDSCAVLGPQPMMIAEFASGEFTLDSLNKATWIKESFSQLKSDYPRIKIFTWFNIKKELDWRVNSSPEAYAAFLEAMKDKYFIGTPE
jgi:endoglucanase